MVAALVPYRWVTDDGMPHWRASGNVTSAIDLRPLALHADPTSIGYAVAIIEGDLPEGAVEFTGNETRDRDAWRDTLGFRPAGTNVREWLFSHLTDGADDAGEAACRPLRCSRPDRLELHLGGKHERQITNTERLKQAVLIRNDLARMVDDERIPRRMLGKFLQAEADRMGIDAITLRGKAAKFKDIRPERPETTISDPFHPDSFIFLNTYTPPGAAGAWTTAGGSTSHWQTGDGRLAFEAGVSSGSNLFAWHPTSVSSSNNQCDLIDVTDEDFCPFGAMCRGNGSTSGYLTASWEIYNRLYSLVSGTATLISDLTPTAQALHRLRVQAIGSTIRGSDVASGWQHSVTNTANTVGLYLGMLGFGTGVSEQYRIAQSLEGRDFLTPTVSSIVPPSGSTAGGTAVTITGTGFESTVTVTIGGASATSVVVVSDTSITCVTPAGTAGAKDIVATNADSGLTGTLEGGFTYAAGGASAAVAVGVSRQGSRIGTGV